MLFANIGRLLSRNHARGPSGVGPELPPAPRHYSFSRLRRKLAPLPENVLASESGLSSRILAEKVVDPYPSELVTLAQNKHRSMDATPIAEKG